MAQPQPRRRPLSKPELLGLTLLIGLVIAIGFIVLLSRGESSTTRIKTEQATAQRRYNYESCNRGNAVRAYLIFNERKSRASEKRAGVPQRAILAEDIFAILDCSDALAGRPLTPVARPVAEDVIRIVGEDHLQPIIRNGKVVSTEPFPANL